MTFAVWPGTLRTVALGRRGAKRRRWSAWRFAATLRRVSASPWPLSAAATQLLLDLRTDGAPQTSTQTISRVAVKELVLRGHLRIVGVRKRRLRSTVVTVACPGPATASQLPAPLDLLALHLPATHGEELAKLVRAGAKSSASLYSKDLKAAGLAELRRQGLTEDRVKKSFGFWPTTFPAPTASGAEAAARARQDVATASTLADLARGDEATALRAARAVGVLILLVPGGLAVVASLAKRWQRGGSSRAADFDFDGFDVLAACVDGLGDAVDQLGDAGGFEGAFDAVASAVDSGIDSGVSEGGGDGSSGGGDGGGCGGGGD